jgi:putative sterol carrier protein
MSEQSVLPRRTARERALERMHGKTMPQLLVAVFNQHGTKRATAKALDASIPTLDRWLEKWGVELRPTQAIAPGEQEAA